jgi:hypothetical protein
MKYYFLFTLFLVSAVDIQAQSLIIMDFEKYLEAPTAYNYGYLKKKGFQPNPDEVKSKTPSYINTLSKEIIKIDFTEDSEGETILTLNYYLPSETNYNHFINSLTASKYKNRGRNVFELATSSYSSLSFETKGKTVFQGKNYFLLSFKDKKGKELSIVK